MSQRISIQIGLILILLGCPSAQGGERSNATLSAEKNSISGQYQHDLALGNTLAAAHGRFAFQVLQATSR